MTDTVKNRRRRHEAPTTESVTRFAFQTRSQADDTAVPSAGTNTLATPARRGGTRLWRRRRPAAQPLWTVVDRREKTKDDDDDDDDN